MTLEWNERYATGHAETDAQHRHLFEMINRMMQVDTADEIKPVLMQLYKHTREHFELEEAEIRRIGSPGLSAHIKGHNQLLSRLNALSAEVGQGRFHKAELVKLMTDWAMNHVVHDDMQDLNYRAGKV